MCIKQNRKGSNLLYVVFLRANPTPKKRESSENEILTEPIDSSEKNLIGRTGQLKTTFCLPSNGKARSGSTSQGGYILRTPVCAFEIGVFEIGVSRSAFGGWFIPLGVGRFHPTTIEPKSTKALMNPNPGRAPSTLRVANKASTCAFVQLELTAMKVGGMMRSAEV